MGLQLDLQSFHYPAGSELFKPVKLELSPGDTVALVGGSGSGKSSLLTLLAGLHPQPLGGRFIGQRTNHGQQEDGIGYLGSDPESFLTGFCVTVTEEVAWTLFGWGWEPAEIEERVTQTLRQLELEELAWQDPRRLSGGQRQMVALAAVWARQPRYLLLDEPASRLDPQARLRLQGTVARLAGEHGAGVLWSTANLGEVAWCQTVWALEGLPAQVGVWPAEGWDAKNISTIQPWPREWARRAGQPLPAWNNTTLVGKVALPSIAGSPSQDLAVEVQSLRYRPPGAQSDLFSKLDWKVCKGDCMALTGVNGAGKTTLARILRGLTRPSSGSVRVSGRPVRDPISALASTVAYTFQEPANLFLKTRVDAELLYSGQLLGLERGEAVRRAELAMETFGLTAQAGCHPRELPAAAAALLGVALSWYSNAALQILDEPLARLDAPGRATLESVIAQWREQQVTIVVIAHDLDWLCTVCSSFSVLDGGGLLAQGSADEVFAQPRVNALLGLPLPLISLAE